ncbi:exported hypothetical protein [Parafrankia sp. Ea1.12]|nr:exported hypothetical protein [Parafrankia sp. Ea1.12]
MWRSPAALVAAIVSAVLVLAFSTSAGGIYLISPSGGDVRQVAGPDIWHPGWSPRAHSSSSRTTAPATSRRHRPGARDEPGRDRRTGAGRTNGQRRGAVGAVGSAVTVRELWTAAGHRPRPRRCWEPE